MFFDAVVADFLVTLIDVRDPRTGFKWAVARQVKKTKPGSRQTAGLLFQS
jgi:hypothetical protein